MHQIEGQNSLKYVHNRERGYSSYSEPILEVAWTRTNISAQYLSVLIVTPLGKKTPVNVANTKCTSNSGRVGTHMVFNSGSGNTRSNMSSRTTLYGSYVHQWHFIQGCDLESIATGSTGCLNGTLDISTPTGPGDYRLQLWTLRNHTLGHYSELMRRSFGNLQTSPVDGAVLRKHTTLLTCGTGSSSSSGSSSKGEGANEIVMGNASTGLLPLLDLALMESSVDLLLHVQYTVNIGVPWFHVKKKPTLKSIDSSHSSNGNSEEGSTNDFQIIDIVNPALPVHLHVKEGDPYQEYTLELSTHPTWVTTAAAAAAATTSDGTTDGATAASSGAITVQITDTCSSLGDSKEVEILSINNEPCTVYTIHINNETTAINHQLTTVPLWNTTLTYPIRYKLQLRTFDNVVQNGAQPTIPCLIRHFVTPTNGNYDKWDVALVIGSRDRVKWQDPTTLLNTAEEPSFGTSASYGNDADQIKSTEQFHVVIDLPILLDDNDSQWISHHNTRVLGLFFLVVFCLSTITRIVSTLYWRSFDAFDLRDLNNEAYHRCLEVNVAGTRHPAALLGSHRFYNASCFWTLLGIMQSFAILGQLRTVEDHAAIVYIFIDRAFSCLTVTSTTFKLQVFTDVFQSISTGTASTIARTKMNTGSFTGTSFSTGAFSTGERPLTKNNNFSTSTFSSISTTASAAAAVDLVNGRHRNYDLNVQMEMFASTTFLSIVLFGVLLLLWCFAYVVLRARVICLITKLTEKRAKSRPQAMTSKVIVKTTESATTAQALR